MQLTLTESELTAIIKEAMEHYKNKPFGRAIFIQKAEGIEVQFCDVGTEEDIPVYRHEEPSREEPDPIPTFHIPDFGGSNDNNPFGGFGGGMSGGAGASGGW